MAVALLALAGLVVDGGAKLDEAENASAVAPEAARAGAGMADQGKAYSTGAFAVDPSSHRRGSGHLAAWPPPDRSRLG
jgi:hypothetical protein